MKRRAFTLIELLVVIAIIAIMAAILFPVFAQAREKARSAMCVSNLRQMGNAFVMYTQDYDEMMPTAWQGPPGGQEAIFWMWLIEPYIQRGRAGRTNIRDTSSAIFVCPSARYAYPGKLGTYWWSSPTNSYGWNCNLGYTTARPGNGPFSLASLSAPAGTIAFGDSGEVQAEYLMPWVFCETYNPKTSQYRKGKQVGSYRMNDGSGFVPFSAPPDWHMEGANMVFADGHVKWYRRSFLVSSAAKSLWDGPMGGFCPLDL